MTRTYDTKGLVMFRKRRTAVAVGVIVLAMAAASVAYAETASVTVTGGSLSVAAADVTLSEVTLDGADQTATSASGSNAWSAIDARGSGLGWNLTIDSTDFSDGGTRSIDVSAADQLFKIQLLDANVGVTAGNTKPTSSVTTLTAIPEAPAAALKFASAAVNTGMGSYTLAPNFELMVPAETFVGAAAYTATITITAVSAP